MLNGWESLFLFIKDPVLLTSLFLILLLVVHANMQKEYITEELVKSFSVLCDGFANTSILSRISNVFLVIGFSTPHSLNYSHFLRRACFLASYFLKFMEITRRCDETLAHFFWVGGLMLINFLVLFREFYIFFWSSRIPAVGNLKEIFSNLFSVYALSQVDFSEIIKYHKVMKSKKSEIIFHDGEVREEPGAIHLLVSGRLTAWIEGIPVHSVEPGEFLDSIEWKAKLNQRLKGEELFKNHREKISQLYYQIRIQSDVPSTYIKLNQHQLKHLERHRPGIFGIFVAVVGRDVAKKMYNLNEHLTLADQVAYKALHRKHSLMRSLSVDTIHTASNGFIVTENWFISCRHKDTQFIKSEKVPSLSSLAYLKEKSSNHCRHQVVIPSLSLQKRLTFWNECPYSKRLSKKESRDPHWKRDILWSSALAHCGFCSWCRPLTVGEKEHASGKRAGETTLEQELQLY